MKEIRIKKIKPLFTALVTTMNKYIEDAVTEGGLIDTTKIAGTVMWYQEVLAVGDSVRNIKVGDMVSINPKRFRVMKHREGTLKDGIISDNTVDGYNFDTIELDGKECLMLQDRDIDFVIEDYEEIKVKADKKSKIIMPAKNIII